MGCTLKTAGLEAGCERWGCCKHLRLPDLGVREVGTTGTLRCVGRTGRGSGGCLLAEGVFPPASANVGVCTLWTPRLCVEDCGPLVPGRALGTQPTLLGTRISESEKKPKTQNKKILQHRKHRSLSPPLLTTAPCH